MPQLLIQNTKSNQMDTVLVKRTKVVLRNFQEIEKLTVKNEMFELSMPKIAYIWCLKCNLNICTLYKRYNNLYSI